MGSRCAGLLWMAFCLLSSFAIAGSFGRTPGQFAVSSFGSAQYTIPIWTPPGIGNVHPSLALAYDSNSGNGIIGPGWNLSGQSAITRCNPTFAQDGAPAPITLTTADRLCLDGKRLRLTSSESLSTYGTASTTYQTEIADFSQVTASSTLAGTGPAYFTVQAKNGLTYEYGNTTDSRVLVPGNSNPYIWQLDKVTDRAGNYMTYTYTQTNGTSVLASIQYAAPSGSSTFLYQVVFNYTILTTPISTNYLAGVQLQQSQELTSVSVRLYNTSTDLRIYKLTYAASPTTLRQRLTSVQECGGSDGGDCLATPTTVGYQDGTAGVASPTTFANSSTNTSYAFTADFDGDGRQDLVTGYQDPYYGNYYYYVQFGTATGYGPEIFTGIFTQGVPYPILVDTFEGTVANQFLVGSSNGWYEYKWNPTSQKFVYTATGIPFNQTTGIVYTSADVDGDGRPDIVQAYAAANGLAIDIAAQFNTSSAGTLSFGTPTIVGTVPTTSTPYISGLQAGSSYRRMDFDGDGRSDFLLSFNYAQSSPQTVEVLSRGLGPAVVGQSFVTQAGFSGVFPVNWNDDACTDLVFSGTSSGVWISQCNGASSQIISLPGVPFYPIDWDGDGRSDLLTVSAGMFQVYLSTGNGVSGPISTGIPVPNCYFFFATDINGDGLDDLVTTDSSGNVYFGLHNGSGVKPDLAISFTDAYGVSKSASYLPMTSSSVYTKGSSLTYPYADYIGPMYLVSSVRSSDGIGGIYTNSYTYKTAAINLQGRGFQGMFTVKNEDSRTGFYDYKDYHISFPYAGMMQYHIVNQNGPYTVRNVNYGFNYETLDSTANNQRYLPYYNTITDQAYELGGTLNGQLITTTTTTYSTPDAYGNSATIATSITDNDPNSPYLNSVWTTSTAYTITPDHSANWCLSLPSEVDVSNTAPGSGSPYNITRHTKYIAPDYVHCRQTEQVVESGSSYQVDTKYQYDPVFGTPTSQTVTGQGMSARTTKINWNQTTGQFPISVSNALNQVSQVNFDSNTGKLLSLTDPNGIKTSWTYDDFGRKNKETRPDGTSTTWAYNSCATAGCVNTNNKMTVMQTNLNSNSTTLNSQNTYFDTFDRVLVTSKQMLSGAYDRNEVQYDNMGNIKQQLAPCTFVSCTQYWTTNTYDFLNRLTASQRPVNAGGGSQTTTYAYAGRTTTTTDANAVASSIITKVTGQTGRTTDANGYYINFDHDAFGAQLSAKDNQSHTLQTATYAYGLQAFPQSSFDIDSGNKTYAVDALGEVTAYTDAKSQSFQATYDALSRPTSRTEPDPAGTFTTSWTWGTTATSHNIGKLASVSSAASVGTYSESYGFDSAGRMTSETIAIPGAGSNRFDFAYSSTTGLLSTLTYPASYPSTYRLEASYAYEYGLLFYISDANNPSTTWYTAATMNPRSQITAEKTSDSSADQTLHLSRNYDAVTGWVNNIAAGVGSGSGTSLQNEAYLYDKLGNVTQRQDNNAGLTENFYYDKLSRLYYSTLGGTTNLQMCYDNTGGSCTENLAGMGNITSRSDIAGGAAWSYDPTHVHEVTQAGNASYTYTYDANGNAKTRNGSTISWTSYNYPSSVSTSSESASFDYGPNRARWHMAYSGPSGSENTYYATPNFEIVATSAGTDYRHYLYAFGAPKLVISRTTAGAVNVRSLLTNHQGSISSIIANSTGTNLVSESFTAYGNRREASTWSGAPTSGELSTMNGVTRQGYTFQTVLGSMGLNHMNGRIEDSVTGIFLSADPNVTDPDNTLAYHRYSYVLNNPLTSVDPTGFSGCPDYGGGMDISDCGGDDPSALGITTIQVLCCTRFFAGSEETYTNVSIGDQSIPPYVPGGASPNFFPVPTTPSVPKAPTKPGKAAPKTPPSANCRGSAEKWIQGVASGVGGAVAGGILDGGPGAIAGGTAGLVTGLVTGTLSGSDAPAWFNALVGGQVGKIAAGFAGQIFLPQGASGVGMGSGFLGGVYGGGLDGIGGAAISAGVGGLADATFGRVGLAVGAAGLAGGASYAVGNAIANSHCGQ